MIFRGVKVRFAFLYYRLYGSLQAFVIKIFPEKINKKRKETGFSLPRDSNTLY